MIQVIKDKRDPSTDNEIIENTIETLLRNDPVTCVRYYNNNIGSLWQLVSHDKKCLA